MVPGEAPLGKVIEKGGRYRAGRSRPAPRLARPWAARKAATSCTGSGSGRRRSREATRRSLRLDFPGLRLGDKLYAALQNSEIAVYAAVDGEVWDLLVSLDLVVPERVEGGWVCRHCVRGVPYTGITPKLYASREDVWRDHLFEEFLGWVNEKLARADTLAFHRFGKGGTSACLLPVDGRVRDTPPAYSVPLKRVAAP